jgi:hypothetical protein
LLVWRFLQQNQQRHCRYAFRSIRLGIIHPSWHHANVALCGIIHPSWYGGNWCTIINQILLLLIFHFNYFKSIIITINVGDDERRQYFIQVGVGEMANHMGYVKNAMAMFISELWASFKHSKSTFLKLCPTKKIWGIKLSFHSRNKLLIWTKTPPWVIFQSLTLIVKTQ